MAYCNSVEITTSDNLGALILIGDTQYTSTSLPGAPEVPSATSHSRLADAWTTKTRRHEPQAEMRSGNVSARTSFYFCRRPLYPVNKSSFLFLKASY